MMGGPFFFFLLRLSTELFPINLYNFVNDTVCHAQPVGEWPPFSYARETQTQISANSSTVIQHRITLELIIIVKRTRVQCRC